MSTTAEAIDSRGYLHGWLQGLVSMYTADINAVPDDKWNATFGGCTRAASELTADAISLLEWTTMALKGHMEEGGYEEYMAGLKSECSNKANAAAKLKSSAEAFSEALMAASDETLGKVITPPWKMDAPLFMIAQIAVSHVWYHDGQLNYIHCLLGDSKVHWMG
jgi:hypothetical protein